MKNIIKPKNQKGITLIALVITIIVLLILAGVSVATLTGDNGLLTRSKSAKLANEIAEEKDQIVSAYSTAKIDKRGDKVEAADLNIALADDKVKANATASTNPGEIKVKFTESQREYIIANDGKIQEGNIGGGNTPTPESSKVKPGEYVTKTEKDNYYDGKEYATIPEGFTVSGIKEEQKISDGLVIYDIPQKTTVNWGANTDKNGMLDVQENYNQFVWVPVPKIENFKLAEGYTSKGPQNYLSEIGIGEPAGSPETLLTGENSSKNPVKESEKTKKEAVEMHKKVEEYKGFYIGRYESSNDGSGKAEIKKGKTPWNKIPWGESRENEGTEGAVAKSRDMYKASNDVTSTLCYGVQWDSTMDFIDRRYITNENNRDDTWKNSYVATHINTGNPVGFYGNSGNCITTGSNEKYMIRNIYDIGGNVSELTMETSLDIRGGENHVIERGSSFYGYGEGISPSSRNDHTSSDSIDVNTSHGLMGFRVCLYFK